MFGIGIPTVFVGPRQHVGNLTFAFNFTECGERTGTGLWDFLAGTMPGMQSTTLGTTTPTTAASSPWSSPEPPSITSSTRTPMLMSCRKLLGTR